MAKSGGSSWADYVDSFRLKDIDPEELNFEGLDQLLNVNGSIQNFFFHSIPMIYLLDYTTSKYRMISKASNNTIGYKPEYVMDAGVYFAMENYQPDFLKTYSEETFRDRLQMLKNIPGEDHAKYVFSHNFKFKTATGEYKNLLQRCSYIKSDANNNPLFSLGMVINLDQYNKENSITEIVEKIHDPGDGTLTEVTSKKVYFLHEEDKIFTKREKEVLLLMADGLTIKAIADKLFLSPYTIVNHRRNMLEKTNTHNSTELVSMAIIKKLV